MDEVLLCVGGRFWDMEKGGCQTFVGVPDCVGCPNHSSIVLNFYLLDVQFPSLSNLCSSKCGCFASLSIGRCLNVF
jgi:hypothetical protein